MDARADLVMQKLAELLSGNNQESRSDQREKSSQPTDGFEPPDIQKLPRDREIVLTLSKGRVSQVRWEGSSPASSFRFTHDPLGQIGSRIDNRLT